MKARRLWLAGLWVLSLVMISFYGGAISYGFFFGVTFVPILSAVYLLFVYFRFKIYQEVASRNIVCGQTVPYFFTLQNDDHFAFTSVGVRMFSTFSYVEKLPDGMEYELLPGDRFTYETELMCKYRGEYEVGVREIVITDFLRLFQIHCPIANTIKALVTPKIVRVEGLTSIGDLSDMQLREAAAVRTEPDVLVRDYMEGDALKQIHWKASAREQKLKVRTLTGEEKEGISILCDTKRYARDEKEYLPLENKMLEALLALGIFFAEKNMTFTAFYGEAETCVGGIAETRVEGIHDFDEFYRLVSEITFTETQEIEDTAVYAMKRGALWNSRVVFWILHKWDPAIEKMTQQLSAGGVIIVIYLITEESTEAYLKENSLRRRLIVIPIEAELDGRL